MIRRWDRLADNTLRLVNRSAACPADKYGRSAQADLPQTGPLLPAPLTTADYGESPVLVPSSPERSRYFSPPESFLGGFRARSCALRRRRLAFNSAAKRSTRLGLRSGRGGDSCFGAVMFSLSGSKARRARAACPENQRNGPAATPILAKAEPLWQFPARSGQPAPHSSAAVAQW